MGGMNLYFVKGKGADATVITPKLTGTLLPGITRDSILSAAKDLGYKTDEVMLSIDDWRDGVKSGEITEICLVTQIFCSRKYGITGYTWQ